MVNIYPEGILPHTPYTIEIRHKDFCQSVQLIVSRHEETSTTVDGPLTTTTTGSSSHFSKLYLGASTHKQHGVAACVHSVVIFGREMTSLTVYERRGDERVGVEG